RKGLDLIVANDVSQPDAGFGVDTNRAILLDSSGSVEDQPLQTKRELADAILDRVRDRLTGLRHQGPHRQEEIRPAEIRKDP
ncbi:MAG: phosphopantothenoylcysteine decarboxylase domain-containing protein, partial [Acidimicrobiia bacterium]